jgi:hypothetical protein
MKRFIIAFLAYVALFLGIFAALLAVFAMFSEKDNLNLRYLFGGAAITSFVISWLLLKISRKK